MPQSSNFLFSHRIILKNKWNGIKNEKVEKNDFVVYLMKLGSLGEEIFFHRTFSEYELMQGKLGRFRKNGLTAYVFNLCEKSVELFKSPRVIVTPDMIYETLKEKIPIELKTNCSLKKSDLNWPPLKYLIQNGFQAIVLGTNKGIILRLNYCDDNGNRKVWWKSDLDIEVYFISYDINYLKNFNS